MMPEPLPEWISISPFPLRDPRAAQLVLGGVAELQKSSPLRVHEIRESLLRAAESLPAHLALETRAAISVLADLRAQGWSLVGGRSAIRIAPPERILSMEERKAQVRAGHLIDRDAQLRDPVVRRFVSEMERRRLFGGAWQSIFSLIRDGRELAAKLEDCARISDDGTRAEALARAVDPYVQIVHSDATCKHTGLRLADIWRYFRHTWNTAYQSTPGRKLYFLVRDRAAPNHCIIGIGALGSSMIQLQGRDKWIGWHPTALLRELKAHPTVRDAKWLDAALRTEMADIHLDDFIEEGILTRRDLDRPSETVIEHLMRLARRERSRHRLYPNRRKHKSGSEPDWASLALTPLFRAKRAQSLASLLRARLALQSAGFRKPTAKSLKRVLENRQAEAAIATILRRVKASQVGIDMMDITVCGAVAPYNELLGGKLVGLLAAGPDVGRAYEKRYRNSASIIASSLKGAPVVRKPTLVLLGTTSLYDAGTSQYNRLWMPADAAGGAADARLAYVPIGRTEGYGSFHFSQGTIDAFDLLLSRQKKGRQVNSIFGEGVNPKLRKVREALELLRLPSDAMLQHGSPRLVFGVPLAINFRDVLMGRAKRVRPIIPKTNAANQAIIEFWRRRWLGRRILQPAVLERVTQENLVYPVRHRARVPLPVVVGEDGPLFASQADQFPPPETIAEPIMLRARAPR